MINDLFITSVDTSITGDLINILYKLKQQKQGITEETCTINGFQTNSLHNEKYMQPYLDYIISLLPSNKLKHRWFHMIDYNKTGYQKEHNHIKTELYSYIIYLEDSNSGITFLNLDNNKIFIKPIKNMIIFFPAYIMHGGYEVIDNKKVAVGALI
jgi:hypothetical protein